MCGCGLDSAGSRQGPRAAFVENSEKLQNSIKQCNLQTTQATLNFTILTLYQEDSQSLEKVCAVISMPITAAN
jgi:hypothetical protein